MFHGVLQLFVWSVNASNMTTATDMTTTTIKITSMDPNTIPITAAMLSGLPGDMVDGVPGGVPGGIPVVDGCWAEVWRWWELSPCTEQGAHHALRLRHVRGCSR